MDMKLIWICVVTAGLLVIGACNNHRAANERVVEQLRQQMLNGKFDEVYEGSSTILKATVARDDFVERMKLATQAMKAMDESLTWHPVPEKRIDRFWDGFDAYSAKEMTGNGQRLWIGIDWNSEFRLCGLAYGSDDSGTGVRVVRACD